ncbi:hypothetical protein P691DRAFT_501514 [Macrolepiota fuliginosa MF-IS2]|uniref:Nephrocystin 3-like N-terminal domain-containing protein n=1 Tax=Macrolepiota fuliginosa MF-IS2 TaxID=1400762 RepID=A0A9P5X242_9AGAR|nr:hypothetical protein P691DRAFT_501514 [Macrolepiota fuliginosa MF-IS2]
MEKRKLDISHEAPRPSKRARIATTSPGNQRNHRQQANRMCLSEGINVAPLDHAQPATQSVNAQRTSVDYLNTGVNEGGSTEENASSTKGLGGGRGGPMTTTEPSSGFFRDARGGVIMHHPNMVDGTQNIFMQGDQSDVLPWLAEYTMQGAEFDSSDRDPPPRCHPGTRTTITNKIHHWLENPRLEKRLFWLRGLAGVGKSAIIQTVAEKLSDQGRLGASLFFSRTNGRRDPRQVFTTLAY